MSQQSDALRLDGETGNVCVPEARAVGLRWIVSGRQVGVEWRQKETEETRAGPLDESHKRRHLGAPSPVFANDTPLRLWLGVDDEKKELVAVMNLAIKLRPRTSNRPRHMFVIVPAEGLHLSSAVDGFGPMSLDQVPEALFERPTDADSAQSSRFIHLGFRLSSKRQSHVVMPTRVWDGQARNTALSLLDSLKSLSEASAFDVYFNFNSYAQVALQQLHVQIDTRKMRFTTPVFDLKFMYPGRQHGGLDLWAAQGWHKPDYAEDKAAAREEHSGPSRKRKAASPLRKANSRHPPAYDAAGHDTPAPVYTKSSSQSRNAPVVALVPRSESPSEPDAHVPRPHSLSFVPETPRPHWVDVSPAIVHEKASTPDASLPPRPMPIVLLPEERALTMSERFDQDMGMWLTNAWRSCPFVHFTLIRELLAVGAAATNQDKAAYFTARVACEEAFIGCLADQIQCRAQDCLAATPLPATQPNPTALDAHVKESYMTMLQSEPASLISWMYMIRLDDGKCHLAPLLATGEVRRRNALAKAHLDDQADFERAMSLYLVSRSIIVACVLRDEGPHVLARLKDKTTAESTTRELERFVKKGECGTCI